MTGRKAMNLFSPADDVAVGAEAYEQILAEEDIVTSGPNKEMVERVVARLVAVADDPGFDWEVALIQDDDTVNAFALPGGKMAVYTGLLPVAQDEAGLAVVLAHEIAHVVARHGTERVTNQLGTDVVLSLLDLGNYEQLAQTAVTLVRTLPFGRKQESEADHIGLIYMARAGYDPRAALGFWQRMDELGGGAPPQWLSTHPSHETRIERLRELMPEALEEYRAAGNP